jgi:hypothetical protein
MDESRSRIYEISALGRPLDPTYPTNRAVLVLLPVAALVAGIVAATGPGEASLWDVAVAGAEGALAAFGAWALAREIAPDDEAAAFVAMGLGFGSWLLVDAALLPVFVALAFSRLVNRSTGLPATLFDSTVVVALALYASWQARTPLPALVGALAFALDAALAPGLARQWLFAGLCAAGGIVMALSGIAPDYTPNRPDLIPRTAATVATVMAIALIATTRSVASVGDATGFPLSVARVRAAQGITLLVAVAAAAGIGSIEAGAVVWAGLVGVALPAAWRGLT